MSDLIRINEAAHLLGRTESRFIELARAAGLVASIDGAGVEQWERQEVLGLGQLLLRLHEESRLAACDE